MGYDLAGLGKRLYDARISKQMAQSEVCEKLNITQSTYSKIENGTYDAKISLLYDISSVLDVSISWLVGENIVPDFTDRERRFIKKFLKYLIDTYS